MSAGKDSISTINYKKIKIVRALSLVDRCV